VARTAEREALRPEPLPPRIQVAAQDMEQEHAAYPEALRRLLAESRPFSSAHPDPSGSHGSPSG